MNRYDANLLLIIEHTWKSWNDVVHFYSCVFTGRTFQFLLFLQSSNINMISDVLWFQRFDAEWFDEKIQRKFLVLTNFSVMQTKDFSVIRNLAVSSQYLGQVVRSSWAKNWESIQTADSQLTLSPKIKTVKQQKKWIIEIVLAKYNLKSSDHRRREGRYEFHMNIATLLILAINNRSRFKSQMTDSILLYWKKVSCQITD